MDEVHAVVIGAGVVGLAVARALAQSGREVLVLERNDAVGTETSSRNSEVIHAGIHNPPGSLKATLCVSGRQMLYRYCEDRSIPHRRVGKLIVATDDDQRSRLDAIRVGAAANGVDDLRLVDTAELRSLEPELQATAALLSPSTGILDSQAFMASLARDARDAGAVIAVRNPVVGGQLSDEGIVLDVGGPDGGPIACREVVNCAGLHAWETALSISGFPADCVPARHLAKGNYFTLSSGRAPFSRLIYPVPADGGLGVHLTLDMSDAARFGPDVEWVADVGDHAVDAGRGDAFYAAIRRYWPGLQDDSLAPAYSGFRPKLSGPGEPAADFAVHGPTDHGVGGLVNLSGIESPGLTASLAIADHVVELLNHRL